MIDWRASAEMASIWAKKPEPALRQKACESFDAIRSRMDEIARSEGRQPHRLNPAAEVEHHPEPEGVYAFWAGPDWTDEDRALYAESIEARLGGMT